MAAPLESGGHPGQELRDAARARLIDLAAAGVIGVDVAHRLTLEDALRSLELVGSGGAVGKLCW